MKKVLSIILAALMVLSSLTFVMAQDDIKITIDGVAKTFDVMPQIIDGRTLVPMRGIFEALGAKVSWNDETKTAIGKTTDTTVSLTINEKKARVNTTEIELDVPAQIIDSRTMVPARFVAESLGCKVDWDANTKTVIISKEVKKEETTTPSSSEGWKELAKVTFESKNAAPATGLNIWGKKADGVNSDGSFSYVSYSDIAPVTKPNNTEDFGSMLLKAASKSESVKGLYEGRINDFKPDVVNYEAGKKYKMSMWAYLGETAKGGNKASITFKVYSGTKSDAFGAGKKFTLEKGKWTLLETEYTVDASGAGQSTGARFAFAAVSPDDFPTVIYMDNLKFEVYGEAASVSATKPAEAVNDDKLPAGGKVILTWEDYTKNLRNPKKDYVDYSLNNGVLRFKVKAIAETQALTLSSTSKKLDKSVFAEGDTFLIKMEARLLSGGKDGKGYVKFQLQDPSNSAVKAIFKSASFGSEWTTVYAPFKQLANTTDSLGFRVGAVEQDIEIRNVELINFGTRVAVKDLPSSLCADPK